MKNNVQEQQKHKQSPKNEEFQRFEFIQDIRLTFPQDVRISNFQSQKNLEQYDSHSQKKQNSCSHKTHKTSRKVIEWSSEEDQILFEKYFQMGPKWVEISNYFPQKCDNAIKNRFYSCLKKAHRKINIVQKTRKLKHRKLISFESLLTLLEIKKYKNNDSDRRFQKVMENQNEIMSVIKLILELAKTPDYKIDDNDVQIAIRRYIEIRHALKFINVKRVKQIGKNANPNKSTQNFMQSTLEDSDNEDKTPEEYEQRVYNYQNINDKVANTEIEAILKLVEAHEQNQGQGGLLKSYKDIIYQIQQRQDQQNPYFF